MHQIPLLRHDCFIMQLKMITCFHNKNSKWEIWELLVFDTILLSYFTEEIRNQKWLFLPNFTIVTWIIFYKFNWKWLFSWINNNSKEEIWAFLVSDRILLYFTDYWIFLHLFEQDQTIDHIVLCTKFHDWDMYSLV